MESLFELSLEEQRQVNGGGIVVDAIKTFYHTLGSFHKGLLDGLLGR